MKLIKPFLNKVLSDFNLKLVNNKKFKKLIEDARYRSLFEVFLHFDDVSLLRLANDCKSEHFQDLIVLGLTNLKRGGFFVEFGAADGIYCSNTFILEKNFNWNGILAEPARIWHDDLLQNRMAKICTQCVWSSTGVQLEFAEVNNPGLSTISNFASLDRHQSDRALNKRYMVETITLIDLLKKFEAPAYIDYLSIDTEGSEFEILKGFDFHSHEFGIIQIENNENASVRYDIHNLLTNNNYTFMPQKISAVDNIYLGPQFIKKITTKV
jgi:FkbM family methyltransferase